MVRVVTPYLGVVEPGQFHFIEPTKAFANLGNLEGGSNEKALQVPTSFMHIIR